MRIAIETEKRAVPFGELAAGDVFKEDGYYYIKIVRRSDGDFSAVQLDSGEMTGFDNEEPVIPKPNCRIVFD